MSFDLKDLLKPIPGSARAGADLRLESGIDSLYFRLKDARAQARTLERATEAAGEPPSIPQEWRTVRSLALEALATHSKDLEIAAWLIEAELRLEGFVGLTNGFDLVRGFVENFWPEIHSIDEDDVAGRVSPLAGLNGIGGEGALVQPIRMLSLLPGSSYGNNGLWHWSRVQKTPDSALARSFGDARAAAGMAAIRDLAMQAGVARDAFADMTAALDRACGADAPPSSHLRNVLDEVLDTYRILVGGVIETCRATASANGKDAVASEAASMIDVPTPAAAAPIVGPDVPRDIETREQAFTELLRVADFFRRNEPHSPIAYSLDTLVRRGRMTFVDLLEELMPNIDSRKQILQHAGIHATTDGKSR